MDIQFLVREFALLIITTIGWLIGYAEHRLPPEKESVHMPIMVRIVFGKISNQGLSIRGVVIQFLMYVIFFSVTLYNLDKIDSAKLVRIIGSAGLLGALLIGVQYIKNRNYG
ncbi:MAG TPA: hypothetical protein DCY14_03305 [Anaerolineae bacterium]|nr:hypothetical protein [Anaerolineae bacterium]